MLIAVEHLAHSLNEGKDIIFPVHAQYVKIDTEGIILFHYLLSLS